MQTTATAQNSKVFSSTFLNKFLNSETQTFLLKALIASFLIGNGVVYGHFRLFHLVGLMFLPYFLARFVKNPKILLSFDVAILLVVLAWYFVSLMWVKDMSLARNYLFYLLNGYYFVLVMCFFMESYEHLKLALKALFYVALADLVVGLVESLTSLRWFVARQSPLNHYFGIDPMYNYYYKNLMERINEYAVSYEYMLHQPSGFHWGPNQFGLFLCILLPFVLFYIRRLWLSIGLSSVILYLSFMIASRAVFLSELLIMFLAVFVFYLQSKQKMKYAIAMLVLLVAIPLAPLKQMGVNAERAGKISSFLGAARNYLKNNLNFDFATLDEYSPDELKGLDVLDESEKEKFIDNSVSQRKIMLVKAYEAFSHNPWRGLGAGSSAQDVGLLFGTTQIHNFWVEIFFELGIVFGSLAFLGIVALFVKLCMLLFKAYKVKNEDYTRLLLATIMALIASVPGILAVGTGAYQPIIWVLFGFALATMRVLSKDLKST